VEVEVEALALLAFVEFLELNFAEYLLDIGLVVELRSVVDLLNLVHGELDPILEYTFQLVARVVHMFR
jgi:hypothetical protein